MNVDEAEPERPRRGEERFVAADPRGNLLRRQDPGEHANGGTRVTYRFTLISKGFMRFLEPFFLGSIKKDTESDFANLKQILER